MDIVKKLLDLGIAVSVDGYEESSKQLKILEEKYQISSMQFYEDYYSDNNLALRLGDDSSKWIFFCNTFLSCGGDLSKFFHEYKESVELLDNCICEINIQSLLDIDYLIQKEEGRKAPLLYNGLHSILSILKSPLKISFLIVGFTTMAVSPLMLITDSFSPI